MFSIDARAHDFFFDFPIRERFKLFAILPGEDERIDFFAKWIVGASATRSFAFAGEFFAMFGFPSLSSLFR